MLAIFSLVFLALPAHYALAVSPANWPASSGIDDRITPTAPYEPSGMAWNSVSEKLFTISDGGVLTKMNKGGVVEREWRNIKKEPPNSGSNADLEALVITNQNSNLIYLGEEDPDSIVEFDWLLGTKTGKAWDLSYWVNTPTNSGLEGAAFVPNSFLPSSVPGSVYGSGGLFYVGVQRAPTPGGTTTTDDGLIYVFDIDLSNSGTFTQRGYITLGANGFTGLTNYNISDMFFNEDTGTLFILYDDGINLLIEVDPKNNNVVRAYTNVPGEGREGFLVRRNETGGSIIYIAHDASTATYITKHVAIYFQDLDQDGLGSHVSNAISTLATPVGYVSNSNDLNDHDFDNDGVEIAVDCNDRDSSVRGPQPYYTDADGDGLGFGTAEQSCTVVALRVTNNDDRNDVDYDNDNINTGIDCNDRDITVLGPVNYYKDADGDGKRFGEPQQFCVATGEYILTTSSEVDSNDHDYDNDGIETSIDCNDNVPAVLGPANYYVDADGDGKGFGEPQQSCTVIPGRITDSSDLNDHDFDNDGIETGIDCNDSDPAVVLGPINYYTDADADGKGFGEPQQSCSVIPNRVTNSSDLNDHDYDNDGIETGIDCNDRDSSVLGSVTYYRDYDQDGLGSVVDTIGSCFVPEGFVINHDDANDFDFDNDNIIDTTDNCPRIYNPNQLDTDADGTGDVCDAQPNDRDHDGVDDSVDCDKYNSQISSPITYYHDGDYDNLGDVNDPLVLCLAYTPAGYVTNYSDLNDNDHDNDGISPPADCDDYNSSLTAMKTYYQDKDGDGWGSKIISTSVCSNSAQTGYVTNNSDFDDEVAAKGIEIKGDNKDNDGDKFVDEVNIIRQNGLHPFMSKLDPFNVDVAKRYFVSAVISRLGSVQVMYSDHAVYEYAVFSLYLGTVRIERYNGTAVIKVTKTRTGESVYINGYTGARVTLPTLK